MIKKSIKWMILYLNNEVAFAATGTTDRIFLEGIQFYSDGAITNSFLARAETHTFRYIQTRYYFDYKKID